jgi:single-stranded-DNA-specific exonuclease
MIEKKWVFSPVDPVAKNKIQSTFSCDELTAGLLYQRSIITKDQATLFFSPSASQIHDPWIMKDMDKAVDRLLLAIEQNEKILIYGDYDVDGTTAVAIFTQFLITIYDRAQIDFYIPHRYREGYGLSQQGLDHANKNGYSLLVTLDCGIKSVEHIDWANKHGIDVIICDHHLPDETLPQAHAILNPKQPECPYPYKELCGCGISYKFICALADRLNLDESYSYAFIDLVAVAIAADIVPITGENRVLCHFGLEKINQSPSIGLQAILALSGKEKKWTISDVVFQVAPRVNAAGRMDDARKAVELFMETDPLNASVLSEALQIDNTDRKEADQQTTLEALSIIENNPVYADQKSIVIYQPHWKKGIVGIVASRIIEHHYKPTIVLTQSANGWTGSARSVEGFNLYDAIDACKAHLLVYGGHFAAAGLTVPDDSLSAFCTAFESAVAERITDEQLIPKLDISAVIDFRQVTEAFYRFLMRMEPYGPGNMKPLFMTRAVQNAGYSKLVKGEHLKLDLIQKGTRLSGIGFRLGHKKKIALGPEPYDIVYTIEENDFMGNRNLQLVVKDLRLSQTRA